MEQASTSEQEFLKKLTENIEANLHNEQFGLNVLPNKMGLERSSLHRKVIKATNISVSQLISQVKLKHANTLLKKTTLSVALESGKAFVGSMTHNGFPFTIFPNLPIYATDLKRLKESWYILQKQGAKMIYPGHGSAFPISKIMEKNINVNQ